MKCVSCGNRKGKRACPALGGSICAVCCGEKRGVEINCPSGCVYYVEGQKQHQLKVMHQRVKKEGGVSYVRRAELYNRNPAVFARLEKLFADSYRANRKLTDKDLASALELTKNTLDTEKKGLIYQHQGENSYANELSTNILIAITDYKDNPEITGDRVDLDFAIKVVDEFLREARFYVENDPNPQSYLVHIVRYHPEELPAPKSGPKSGGGLIITP